MVATPNYPLLMASGVAIVVGALVGSAALTGALPALAAKQQAAAKACATCGVVTGIKKRALYDVTVQMDDGRVIIISQSQAPAIELGDRVRVNGDVLVRG
jgi:outer membrane lipoprotein SlyB